MNFLIDGLKSWLIQRVSAVFLVFFSLYLLSYFLFFPPENVLQWQAWFYSLWNRSLFALFFILLLLHAWVGVRDVIFDYIKPQRIQGLLLFTLAVFLIICALWMGQILF